MNLFNAYVRKDTSSRKLSESEYEFLDRSALPAHEQVRSLLKRWFHDYPSDRQKSFCFVRSCLPSSYLLNCLFGTYYFSAEV